GRRWQEAARAPCCVREEKAAAARAPCAKSGLEERGRDPTMNPSCARCGKIVYPTEKVNCLDKFWHKACFHCEICKMTLNMKNYKGYDKKPYCNS
ncbi:hypothetical protein NDU88_001819, partial [Pleurodeles waltl]